MTDTNSLGTDVSVTEYLAHTRPQPYLYELAPHQDPEAFLPEGPLLGAPLFATIRAGGGRRTDVRLLVNQILREEAPRHPGDARNQDAHSFSSRTFSRQ